MKLMKVVYVDLDNENKVTGEMTFDNMDELKTFLGLVSEYGVDNNETHSESYIKFNPVKNRFEIQYEE